MEKTPKLTLRQQKFCEIYLNTGNATHAAKEAGFMPSYAQGVLRYPSVKAHLAKLRAEHIPNLEIIDFLKAVMCGEVKKSALRTQAAIQLGIRAGLWKNETEAIIKIEEELKHE